MCGACGFPSRPGHWTDAGTARAADRLRVRHRRLGLINRLLKPYGLSARDNIAIPGFQLIATGGKRVLVPDLEALWAQAAQLAGSTIDPLSARALDDAAG